MRLSRNGKSMVEFQPYKVRLKTSTFVSCSLQLGGETVTFCEKRHLEVETVCEKRNFGSRDNLGVDTFCE